MDSEETPGDSMIVSSSITITEVRLLIVYIIVDVNVILDTKTYILCAGDLRRLNEYLDTIAETIEPPSARATAGKKKAKRKNSAAVAETFGITRVSIPGGEGKRSRIQKVY